MSQILLALRRDVAANFRDLVNVRWNVQEHFAAVRCRTTDSAPRSGWTHVVAHGRIPSGRFDDLRTLLSDATAGVRTSVDWQGRGRGNALAAAEWAIAFDGAELVCGYTLTQKGAVKLRRPVEVLNTIGLVPVWTDYPEVDEEIPQ